jgi:hypothetical protein
MHVFCQDRPKIDQKSSPNCIVPTELKGDLKADIESTFGSVENFNKEFSTAGATQVQLQQRCHADCLSH